MASWSNNIELMLPIAGTRYGSDRFGKMKARLVLGKAIDASTTVILGKAFVQEGPLRSSKLSS